MSFLTKPTVTKGQPSIFALVKSQLINVPKIDLDDFFKDTTNWKRVTVQYENTHGQEEVLVFDASLPEPTATFSVSTKARSDYQITSIVVTDLDDGMLVISRSDLSTETLAMLDVSFQEVITARAIQWDSQNTAYETFGTAGVRTTLSRTGHGTNTPLLGEILSGNFSIEFSIPLSTTTSFYHGWGLGEATETGIYANDYSRNFAGVMHGPSGLYSAIYGANIYSAFAVANFASSGEAFLFRIDKIGTTLVYYKNNIEIYRVQEPRVSLLVKPIINLPGRSDNNGNDSTMIVTVTALA